MGRYYNPPTRIPDIGRLLRGSEYDVLRAQLQPDEVLIGCFENTVQGRDYSPSTDESETFAPQTFRVARWIESQDDLAACREPVQFYAVVRTDAELGSRFA